MISAKELLAQEVARLSEEDARTILEVVRGRTAVPVSHTATRLTSEDLIRRAGEHAGIGLPDPEALPFEKFERIETRGVPTSELLIADRR